MSIPRVCSRAPSTEMCNARGKWDNGPLPSAGGKVACSRGHNTKHRARQRSRWRSECIDPTRDAPPACPRRPPEPGTQKRVGRTMTARSERGHPRVKRVGTVTAASERRCLHSRNKISAHQISAKRRWEAHPAMAMYSTPWHRHDKQHAGVSRTCKVSAL